MTRHAKIFKAGIAVALLVLAQCGALKSATLGSPSGAGGAGSATEQKGALAGSLLRALGLAADVAGDPLEAVRVHVTRREVPATTLALAAAVSGEGHWTFVTVEGQRYTAATPREMTRMRRSLAGGAAAGANDGGPLLLYLTAASVFVHAEYIALLPRGAQLRIVVGDDSLPLVALQGDGERSYVARVRANVLVPTRERSAFLETAWQLRRRLERGDVRVLSLDPNGPVRLTPRPGRSASSGQSAPVDVINPAYVGEALAELGGQTVVIIGRLSSNDAELTYRTPSGRESSIEASDLRQAARANDVNLLIVKATAPRQPGARNWFWQRVEVDGLAKALGARTLGGFLNAVAGGEERLVVEARPVGRGAGRVRLHVLPLRGGEQEVEPGLISNVLAELVSEVVGNVMPHAVDGDLVSKSRQRALDRRIVPGIPWRYQYGFVAALALGFMTLPIAWAWWGNVWPRERRRDYADSGGHMAARLVRLAVFLLAFLPVVALPAMAAGIVRVVCWVRGRRKSETGAKPALATGLAPHRRRVKIELD